VPQLLRLACNLAKVLTQALTGPGKKVRRGAVRCVVAYRKRTLSARYRPNAVTGRPRHRTL